MKRFALGLLLIATSAAAAWADEPVTFTKHVAPILWKSCAGCHNAASVGPFPLLTYKDAAKRADFLRDVTASRRMPPWRAEPGFGPKFQGERRLSDAELQTLARWAATGVPEGDPRDLPPLPKFPTGWQLGQPDLVVRMPEEFPVPADGPDVYRCFVIPLPVDGERTVAAVEFHPGNKSVIHHAAFYLDNKGQARKKERQDGLPGYTSFGGPGIVPLGGLGGWGLANLPKFLPEGTGMILPQGCDLVMQIHYHPNGKPQTDLSELGIFFTKRPATKFVTALAVRTQDIAIPPGDKRHRVTCDSAPLAADVTAMSVTPHMHFLGREVKCTATLPDGRTMPLVWVKDWDFHWHENYYFAEPLRLPKGTIIHVEAFYDNSADNPKNPNNPPKLVKYGNNLTDEMLSGHLQVVCDSKEDLRAIDGMKNSRYGPGAATE